MRGLRRSIQRLREEPFTALDVRYDGQLVGYLVSPELLDKLIEGSTTITRWKRV